MTANKVHDAKCYAFQADEPIFVDANVWIYFQPPSAQPTPADVAVYGTILKNALTAKARPLIDLMILGEYMYRCCRIEMGALRRINVGASSKYSDLHKFRTTPEFPAVATTISNNAKEILMLCELQNTEISSPDLARLLDEFPSGAYDFNDGVVVNSCRQKGWKFLTHDEEIVVGGIEVLTANPRLLKACS
jgi:hypothetical protein